METLTAALRRHRYLILLVLLIWAVVVQSQERSRVGVEVLAQLLVGVSLFAMVLVVFEGRRVRVFALWAWVLVVVLSIALHAVPYDLWSWLKGALLLFLAVFHGWAAALILRGIFRQDRVGRDEVFGAVCGYILAAGGWANLYALCEFLVPGSFVVSPGLAAQFADPQARDPVLVYFSMVTITTVGYGDITPARGPVAVFAMLEMVFGQFYIAVVVAQLVGMRLAQGMRGRDGD